MRIRWILSALMFVASVSAVGAAEFFVGGPVPVLAGQDASCSVTNIHATESARFVLRYFDQSCLPGNEYSGVLSPGRSIFMGLTSEMVDGANQVCVIEISPHENKARFKKKMQGAMTIVDDKGVPLASVPLVYTNRKHPCLP